MLTLALCAGLTAGQSTDRNNPAPLARPEVRGNVVPGGVQYYAFEAGPGDLTLQLEVSSNGDYSLVYVQVSTVQSQSLLEFEASSTSDRRERRLIVTERQPLILQISSPKTSQGGTWRLRIGGAFKGAATLASGQNDPAIPLPNPVRPSGQAGQTRTPVENNALPPVRPPVTGGTSAAGSAGVTEIDGPRVALVIGNAAYRTSPLRNPVNDSRDMAQALRECGFAVTQRENLTRRDMEEQIRAFGRQIARGSVALFYYSGHGLQIRGVNYLLPVDARIDKEQDVEFEAVDMGRVIAEIEAAGSRLNMVILDACRDNPFARSFRSTQRGLAVVSAPSGTVIIYSTAPGMVADDGEARNGRYTAELLRQMREPGLKLEDVLKRVRVVIREQSGGMQIPWETTSIDGDFYFMKPASRNQQ